MAKAPTITAALSALKVFAHLPIRADQPDDAYPAFQIPVSAVRAARELFPDDFVAPPKGLPTENTDTTAGTLPGTPVAPEEDTTGVPAP